MLHMVVMVMLPGMSAQRTYILINDNFLPNDSKQFSKNVVKEAQDAGKVCVLEIDINGAKQVRNSDLNPIYVFIMPPSIHELRRRLTGRGTETPEKIEDRINNAQGEIEYGNYNLCEK